MADIPQITKFEGNNTTFIWKSLVENFNTGSQRIVRECYQKRSVYV